MSSSTGDLATRAAYTTIWSRADWLAALASVPARYDLDDGHVGVIAKLASAYGMTPRAAVVVLFPKRGPSLWKP